MKDILSCLKCLTNESMYPSIIFHGSSKASGFSKFKV